jgi:hypothetical protein
VSFDTATEEFLQIRNAVASTQLILLSDLRELRTFDLNFTSHIQTKRRILRSTQHALRFIDSELPIELKNQSRWTFARALLVEAERTGKSQDLNRACRQLRQALANDALLVVGRPRSSARTRPPKAMSFDAAGSNSDG